MDKVKEELAQPKTAQALKFTMEGHRDRVGALAMAHGGAFGDIVISVSWDMEARPARTPPALFKSLYQKTGFNSLRKKWVLTRTIDWRNGYPGYHLRCSRSTQSAGGPAETSEEIGPTCGAVDGLFPDCARG